MTTYQVQLRDFRSKRITQLVSTGQTFASAAELARGALFPFTKQGDEMIWPVSDYGSFYIRIKRRNGCGFRDEYVRLVPEPPPPLTDTPGECNRCYASTPPADGTQ